jgi:hypothetical protein
LDLGNGGEVDVLESPVCCVVPEFGGPRKWKKKENVDCKNSQGTKRVKVKVIRGITNRRDVEVNSHCFEQMRARAGNLKMTMALVSRGCAVVG